MSAPSERLKAYRVFVSGFGDDPVAIVMAETRGKAIGKIFWQAKDAGYNVLRWWDFRAIRAAEFDRLADQHGRFSYSYEHALRMLESHA